MSLTLKRTLKSLYYLKLQIILIQVFLLVSPVEKDFQMPFLQITEHM